ncbi:MAG: type II toxin-antitoxin system ParD family antitoxin [Rhodocyclaceae bacterium]|nr:type II toxin-antitoxin system ParD family antitoxin [Rhodocyclaceae bacterium]
MPTVNISIPESLKAFVEEQVSTRGYRSVSEYFRDLVRRERDAQHVRNLIDEGIQSGLGPEVGAAYWEELDKFIANNARSE